MAIPTPVNGQITDSVTQTDTKELGDSSAVDMGNLYQATDQALSNAAHNATNNQQQSYETGQAPTSMDVETLDSVDPATTDVTIEDILNTEDKEP